MVIYSPKTNNNYNKVFFLTNNYNEVCTKFRRSCHRLRTKIHSDKKNTISYWCDLVKKYIIVIKKTKIEDMEMLL